ncbi:hypothetical protein [Photobacterium rosenbergii]|uniref:hypothetical protein n=1 Tax=Photobacterium rosenbergii TaxID=294936 RepID=UPI001C99EA80|nr:hypothetical protein [Photobacterium rosenbergii]MBY5948457.1 hypothetical protein [Photobacterium rosenbergii]
MAEEDEASAYLHPDAFWYGSSGLEIYRKLKNMYPNETDTMNRYKDYAIKKIAEDGSFLLSYTECYQDSPFATCGRSKAWFSEGQDGDITFMGRKDDIPLNVQAILIARRSAWADDQSAFDWSIEIDAFPDASSVCGKIPDSFNNTSWFAGIPKLAEMKDYMPVETVTITGDGIDGALVLDRIYKEVNGGIITACHLASSTYGYTDGEGNFHPLSLVIDGYAVGKQEMIRDNTSYNVEYQYVDGSPNTVETITVGKGKTSDEEMAPYLATINELRNTAGDFYMRWSRESQLATDIDVWVTEVNEYGSKRVAVESGAHEVSSDELDALKHAYLVAFDEYGRSISVGYDFNN